jgi:hypothetical protein
VPARARIVIALLLSAGLVAGAASCSESPSPTTPSLEETLTATVELPRLVRDPRTVAVLVHNHGSSPVHVRQVELVTESFAPTGPTTKDVVIAGGSAKSLSLTYGEGRCEGALTPPVAPAHAALVVEVDGQPVPVDLPLPNADDLAPRLHADCAAQTISAAASFQLTGWAPGPDGRLHATLQVSRVADDEPITVYEVSGSAIYRLTPAGALPAVLVSGADRIEIPITASAARCDGHAMADVKFPYLFRAFVTIGHSPRLPANIDTDSTGQSELPRMWHVLCGI